MVDKTEDQFGLASQMDDLVFRSPEVEIDPEEARQASIDTEREVMRDITDPSFEGFKSMDLAAPPMSTTEKSPYSRRPGFRGDGPFDFKGFGNFLKENVSKEELTAGLDNAGQWMVPFYESGSNLTNVISEYNKPEDERDYDYIKEELGKAGNSAATEAAMWLLGGVAVKYGGKGIKAIADKVKQYEIDPNTTSAFGVGAIKKKAVQEGVPTIEAAGLTDEAIDAWRKANETSPEFRKSLKGRNEELMDLAAGVKEGRVFNTTYRKRADELRPIRKVTDVPKPATVKDTVSALDANKRKSPIVDLNYTIPDGDSITARLDINAYTNYDTWVPTLRHAGKTMYKPALRMKNVRFIQPEGKEVESALNVAVGPQRLQETFGLAEKKAKAKGNKSPFAVMEGSYVQATDDEAYKYATSVFDNKEWTQVGYDPTKRGFFYDRETGEAILEATEVVQVGHLVLAKNAKKTDPEVFGFNEGGMVKNQMQGMFKSVRSGMAEGGSTKPRNRWEEFVEWMKSEKQEEETTESAFDRFINKVDFKFGGDPMERGQRKAAKRGMALGGEVNAIDPESGNEVPPGSLPEEVRDDIPTMLSEGEYVVPADVTRYYGVKFFESLRDNAKVDLAEMQENGRIGGQPIPEDDDDLTEDEMRLLDEVMGMNQGGMVNPQANQQMQMNNPIPSVAPQQQQPMPTSYNQPSGMAVGGTVQAPPLPTGQVQNPTLTQYNPQNVLPDLDPTKQQGAYGITTAGGAPVTQQTPATNVASGSGTGTGTGDVTMPDAGGGMKTVFFIHKDGRRISVLMLNGKPISSVPADFSEFLEDTPENRAKLNFGVEEETTPETEGATVASDDDGDDDFNTDIKTKVDPNTLEGKQAIWDDSGVSVRDPAGAAKEALNDALQVPKAAGMIAGAINPFLGVAVAAGNAASQLTAVSKAQANKQMAEFLGKDDEAAAIQKELDDFLKDAPGIVNALDDIVAKGTQRFNNAVEIAVDIDGPEEASIFYDELNEKGTSNVNEFISSSYAGANIGDDGVIRRDTPEAMQEGLKSLGGLRPQLRPSQDDSESGVGRVLDDGVVGNNNTGKNSFMQKLANDLTPNDGKEYVNGKLVQTEPSKTTTTTGRAPVTSAPAEDKSPTPIVSKPAAKPEPEKDVTAIKTTNVVNRTNESVEIGQVSAGGQNAGDGFVWEKKPGTNVLTRKYVGTSSSSSSSSSSNDDSSSSSSSSSDSGGCCFIMLEARYGDGTMDEVVRRYRDEYMTDRNRRGYYRTAEVLVPLMRKSKVFKWVVTKTFADPLVSYGKYYYGQNKHGVIYSPVKNFWMKVFDVVGGDTEFIRENGEVV